MCGIYSILNRTGEKIEFQGFQSEFEKIKHRGPDNSQLKGIDETVLFGFHRLRINGVDEISDQPLYYKDVYLICNGEIYNKEELVKKYGFKMETNSDCEVILHLYKKFGIERTVEELDGEYSFCLYDKGDSCFYIARDHIGIRPLFVGKNDGDKTIGFASEAKALIGSFKKVNQFPPGCYAYYELCDDLKDTLVRWYDYDTMDLISNGISGEIYQTYTREQILAEVKYRFIKSVNDRTYLSDRLVGCFLSGGLDSSLVTAIMARKDKNIPCFTIGLKGSLDLIAAEKVAKFLRLTNHHVVVVTVEEAIAAIPHVIKSLESYDITTIRASTFQWLLSKYIKENTEVTVLQSGEVPDESVPGYWAFAFCKSDDEFTRMSRDMIEELHEYDLLRTDRTTANFGLEVRVPFADKKLMKMFHNVPIEFRKFDANKIEKSLLRDAFREGEWLPKGILNRKKHAFSDAINAKDFCFYDEVEKFADSVISKEEWDKRVELYPDSTPVSKESFYYRKIFESHYPGRSDLIRGYWMPKVKDENGELILDPSATALPGHKIDTEF